MKFALLVLQIYCVGVIYLNCILNNNTVTLFNIQFRSLIESYTINDRCQSPGHPKDGIYRDCELNINIARSGPNKRLCTSIYKCIERQRAY